MSAQTLKELLVHELKDLYDAEQQLTKALPKVAEEATSPELKSAVENHLKETLGHVKRLEQVFDMLHTSAARQTCQAMKGLIEETNHTLKETEGGPVRDAALIASAQRVEHYEMAGYGTVRTYAELLGHKDAAKLLQQTLDEEGNADKKLTEVATHVNAHAVG